MKTASNKNLKQKIKRLELKYEKLIKAIDSYDRSKQISYYEQTLRKLSDVPVTLAVFFRQGYAAGFIHKYNDKNYKTITIILIESRKPKKTKNLEKYYDKLKRFYLKLNKEFQRATEEYDDVRL
jgi:hypothetical protein